MRNNKNNLVHLSKDDMNTVRRIKENQFTSKCDAMQAKKRIYYAHPMILYGSEIEYQDVKMLEEMGFEVVNPNKPGNEEKYLEKKAFGFFLDIVRGCDALAFRSILGAITTGVGKEVTYAQEHKMPVIELPYITEDRFLSLGTTNAYFRPHTIK